MRIVIDTYSSLKSPRRSREFALELDARIYLKGWFKRNSPKQAFQIDALMTGRTSMFRTDANKIATVTVHKF